MKKSLLAALLLCSTAQAQVYNQDAVSFEGVMFVLDNPTSPVCQAAGVNFGNAYRFTYAFFQNPFMWTTPEGITLFDEGLGGSSARHYSPLRGGLSGTTTGNWAYFGRYGGAGSVGPSTATLTIQSGINTPIQIGVTGTIKINGTFGDFLSHQGCTVTIHGAGAVKPN